MIKIGCHLSSSKGFKNMAENCKLIGANAFQYFSRNPRGSKAKEINQADLDAFLKIDKEIHFGVVAHAPYVLNLCSKSEHIRNYSKVMLEEDIKNSDLIPGSFYNLHPGSHTGQGTETGIKQISDALNYALKEDQKATVLLETMAGKGSEIGGKFEEIAQIIKNVNLKEKVGVCLDTCHVFDGGYDIAGNLEKVLEHFDEIIGISKLKVIHLNDSKNALGSKKDRHEQIGKGTIGLENLINITNNKYLKDLVFILETPQESLEGYAQEIKLIKSEHKD